jgi:hypothetical protein
MRRRQRADDSAVCVKLSSDASVTLAFKGNLFDLTPAERELISALSDVIQKHEGLKADSRAAA